MLGYVIFWIWYFSERHVSLERQEEAVIQTARDNSEKEDNKVARKEEKSKEFTDDDLKNFWLEINTSDVKIKAPIVNGVSDEDLDIGIGRHKTTALPGEEGNIVLSGHRWKLGRNPAYKVFKDLDKLENGDRVVIHYGWETFEYEIYKSGVVKDHGEGAKEVMEKIEGENLTLYTCTPIGTAFRRLYYRAKRVDDIR